MRQYSCFFRNSNNCISLYTVILPDQLTCVKIGSGDIGIPFWALHFEIWTNVTLQNYRCNKMVYGLKGVAMSPDQQI